MTLALTGWEWLGSAVSLPVIAIAAGSAAKAVGRWLGSAITDTMSEAITNTMQPQLAEVEQRLTKSINSVGRAGSSEHEAIVTRVNTLEGRVDAVEKRLPPISTTTTLEVQS